MPVNDFLQFGNTGVVGTDLLSQTDYAADADRPKGHQPGIARAKLENKALKQCSTIAAMIGQFIADNQSNDVLDTDAIATLESHFISALNTAVTGGGGGSALSGTMLTSSFVSKTTYQDVTSSSWVDVSGLSTSISITNGPAILVADTGIEINFDNAPNETYIRLMISGGEYGSGTQLSTAYGEGLGSGSFSVQIASKIRTTLADNTTYTIKVQVRNDTANPGQNARINASFGHTVANADAFSWLDVAAYKS